MALSFDYTGNTVREVLKAASRDTLFSNAAIGSQWVAVRDDKGRIIALQGTMLGATQEYKRVTRK